MEVGVAASQKKKSKPRRRKSKRPNQEIVVKPEVYIQEEDKESERTAAKKINKKKSCAICYDDDDESNMFLVLECGHAFHSTCINQQLAAKWSGVRISLNYANCAICRKQIKHESIEKHLKEYEKLRDELIALADEKAKEDEIDCGNLSGDERREHLLKVLAFYYCKDCKKPFCGGLVLCSVELEIDANQLRCQACVFSKINDEAKTAVDPSRGVMLLEDGSPDLRCMLHGYRYAVFKCDSCCNTATYDCIYNHYCDPCHSKAYAPKKVICPGEGKCPLGIKHPPNQDAIHSGKANAIKPFVLGCLKCIGLDSPNQEFSDAPFKF